MAPFLISLALTSFFPLLVLYLWHVNRAMSGTPPDALKVSPNRWTKEEIRAAYKKAQGAPTDVRPYLHPKQSRRYIVAGGSGLVGGWVVEHLLMRGEDPSAIRILDLMAPARLQHKDIHFVQTDVTDQASVTTAFGTPWPNPQAAKLPLTVFHVVAYIKPSERTKDFLSVYLKVNVTGTHYVLDAAKAAGATCFVATSSGSIGVKPPKYFLPPWRRWPQDMFQVLPNAEPGNLEGPLEDFGSCYAFSKAQAEKVVREADDQKTGFRTGCIRPGHAIYGHGMENLNSISWNYLCRGGSPSWLWDVLSNFVNAQNVSVAHLSLEAYLTSDPSVPGGRAYCCTDPNPPITYGDLYTTLSTLAHSSTPARFPPVPPLPMLLLGHAVELYTLLRQRYLNFLPAVKGDLAVLTPAMFNMSTTHLIYDDLLAREELGYQAPIQTLEGLCLQLVEWNDKVEARLAKGEKVSVQTPESVVGAIPAPIPVGRDI